MQLTLTASPRGALVVLLWMRVLAVLGQSAAVVAARVWLGIDLPLAAMGVLILGIAVVALLTALRLRFLAWPCTHLELAGQLLLDVAALTCLLYLSGGVTNPFASLYLVPIAFAAVGLAWWYTAAIVLACLAAYLMLMQHFVPLAYRDPDATEIFNLHILGMTVNFMVSAVLLGVFLAIMTLQVRRRDHEMARLREETLQREHLASQGLLAAGAAHELGTPLSTIAVLASEMESRIAAASPLHADIRLLRSQIGVCKQKLNELLLLSGHGRAPEAYLTSARNLLQGVMDDVSVLHPRVRFELRWTELGSGPMIRVEAGLAQALRNLMNNAADASVAGGGRVEAGVIREEHGLSIYIDDDGPGLSDEARRLAGRAVFTSKSGGLGLGLVLSNANLNRLGGDVTLSDRDGGGTRTHVRLPDYLLEADSHG